MCIKLSDAAQGFTELFLVTASVVDFKNDNLGVQVKLFTWFFHTCN